MANFFMPTRIVHGDGAIEQLADICTSLGISRPFVVTDLNIAATEFFRRANAALDGAGIAFDTFDECAIDARTRQIADQTERFKTLGSDGVIGIGGGSVMCAAKAVGVMATNPGQYADYIGAETLRAPPVPNIMVPTTAGSGSEVSGVSVVFDEDEGRKFAVRDSRQYPTVAILDPMAIESCPPPLAVYSALDAFAHAVEGYLSPKATSLTGALGLKAAGMLIECAKASAMGKESSAMADNLLASSMANISFGSAGLGMVHLIAQPFEEIFHVPHGKAVGIMLPRVLEVSDPLPIEKLTALARNFGVSVRNGPAGDVLASIVGRIDEFYESLGLSGRFEAAEADSSRSQEIVEKAHAFSTFLVKREEDDRDLILSENGHKLSQEMAKRVYAEVVA